MFLGLIKVWTLPVQGDRGSGVRLALKVFGHVSVKGAIAKTAIIRFYADTGNDQDFLGMILPGNFFCFFEKLFANALVLDFFLL